MGLFGSSDQTTKSTTVPWAAAQGPLKYGMGQARKLYNQKAGYNSPGFQTYAPMSGQTRAGLQSIYGQAQGGNPLAAQSEGAIGGILGGATNDKYNQLFDNSSNAAFEQNVQNQSNHIADDVQRQFSGLGRIGSAADTGALVNQLGEYRTKAMADNWNQNIANQRGILGDQSQGQLAAVAAAPGAYQQRFLPGQAMGQVGQAYDDLNARKLQSRLDRFNTRDMSGLNRLGAYNGNIAGGAGAGQSSTSTVQQPSNWLGGALGGALGGGKLFGAPGAIGGGILGLLSGLG